MKTASIIAAVVAASLSGCAIHQNVRPVDRFDAREVCVIDNPAVKFDFLPAYRRALEARGYAVKMLPASAGVRDCPITTTYTANWRWDLAMYMAYAEIKVYNNGKAAGEAVYDALKGGGNMSKFIKGEEKIKELVTQLFPG